ncbi:MAG: hypothetical protein H7099_18190 [Gemmatimonadaceae bacterium]|nr:hypothetical protein [Gemmatimonadaceae bacterium]
MPKARVAPATAVASGARFVVGLIATLAGVIACSSSQDDAARADSARADSANRARIASDSQARVSVVHAPLSLDTVSPLVLEIWPLALAPGRQIDETRRIVEHLQADLTLTPGFESATLLASGDGTALVLLAAWQDDGTADRADSVLAQWLHAETDTLIRRRRIGTATTRVRVRRTVGSPPALSDAAMLQFTRYAMKPGHSFGALAALADSNLATRVLQDTSAQGGATLVASDSGALYVLVQARSATALDPVLQAAGRLPFWAPFAEREEQLMSVVAVFRRR